MSNKDRNQRRDFDGLDDEFSADEIRRITLHMDADIARRLEAAELWSNGDYFADMIADAVRERMDQAERERMSRGPVRIDMTTGQIIEGE